MMFVRAECGGNFFRKFATGHQVRRACSYAADWRRDKLHHIRRRRVEVWSGVFWSCLCTHQDQLLFSPETKTTAASMSIAPIITFKAGKCEADVRHSDLEFASLVCVVV